MSEIISMKTGRIFLISFCFCFISLGSLAQNAPANATRQNAESAASQDERRALKTPPRAAKILRQNLRNEAVPPGVGKIQAVALNRAFRELDLSEEQKEKVRAIWAEAGVQIRRLQNLRRAKAVIFDDALYGTELNPSDAETKLSDLAQTEAELLKTQMKMILDVRLVLNPAQVTKFRAILEEERARPLRALQQ